MELGYTYTYTIAQFLLLKGVGLVYLFAFVNVINEFRPLLGKHGLLPVPEYLRRVDFSQKPSIFHFHYSDAFAQTIGWTGIVLSLLVLIGSPIIEPWWVISILFVLLWALYLSVVNVGQIWYSFGWESMLLEAGFYAIFLGPAAVTAPLVVLFIFRWMLFRVEFGAGLIKIRGDQCWRDLTCMNYHHETQPMPNPLSWVFHNLPGWFHRLETGFNHVVQLVVPFLLFFPQPVAAVAAGLIILSQSYLLVSGNYSWLNFLTIILAFAALPDQIFSLLFSISTLSTAATPTALTASAWLLCALVAYLSVKPIKNLISGGQLMNYSFNPYHLVNTYGAFGTVTKTRWGVVITGTQENQINDETRWGEYQLKGKPTDPKRMPPQIAPNHLRLDWLLWFVGIDAGRGNRSSVILKHSWLQPFLDKLLAADEDTLTLLKHDPFDGRSPEYIRADLYQYRFTTPAEWWNTGKWWYRQKMYTLIPPQS